MIEIINIRHAKYEVKSVVCRKNMVIFHLKYIGLKSAAVFLVCDHAEAGNVRLTLCVTLLMAISHGLTEIGNSLQTIFR